MKSYASKRIWIVTLTLLACTACVSTGSSTVGMTGGGTKSPKPSMGSAGHFGDVYAVQATIGTIKLQGVRNRVSSRAIRLPERPLGEIAVFGYQFPSNCGGHEFRVFEAQGMQVLEYQYAALGGETHMIRDYVSGPSAFVEPGLWSAYDHTAGSISTMTSQFEQRGAGMFNGVYSQGLITNLPVAEQRTLGNAYQQALSDVHDCRDTQTLAGSSTN